MRTKAMVLEEFNRPLKLREIKINSLSEGEVLVKIVASGICGSDVHIWRGKDPRAPLPLILGHEGVGVVQEVRGDKRDVFNKKLSFGDTILWDRGVTCGNCYYCSVKKQPFLCPSREVYGIVRDGCYAEHLVLLKNTKIFKIEDKVDLAILVATSCSGATAAHAVEECNISPGDNIVIQGPGPLGIFALIFCLQKGAKKIIVTGREGDRNRLDFCREAGADMAINIDNISVKKRIELVKKATNGLGADAVIECTGSPDAPEDGLQMVAPGGIYCTPGIAVPTEKILMNWYPDIVRKNVSIKGIWVSDTSHLYQAITIALNNKIFFQGYVTHRFDLQEANEALRFAEELKMIKGVFQFSHGSP